MSIHLLLHPYVWDNVDAVGHYACLKDQGKEGFWKSCGAPESDDLFRPSSCVSFPGDESPSIGKLLVT